MRNKIRSLSRANQARLLTYLYLLRLTELHPSDMILPVVIAQAISMIVFLPSHNIFGHVLMSFITVAIAILPGLAKPILSTKLVK